MGDRISIQFKNKDELSVVLFSHWDGKDLLKAAKKYVKELKIEKRDPNRIIIDFLYQYLKQKGIGIVDSNYYLAKDENEGDNSDNGHHVIKLN